MPSPAAAIGWEFWTRQRWVLVAVPAYLLVLALIKPAVAGPGALEPGDGFAAFGVVPFSATFMYFIAVFTFGLNGDVAARQSIYPARFFTLPVPTVELARWPMFYGASAMMLLWFVASPVGRWALNINLPWLWPAFLAAAVLAWTQAFMWMPYGLRGLRVVAAVTVLILLDTIVILAINFNWSEAALIAFLAPQLPLAYLCACVAVARARRGVVPDWSISLGRVAGDARALRPFRSSAAAQLWFEWRRHGRSLPMLVAMVLPFELALPFITGYGSTTFIFELLLFVLVTPIVMAGFAGATVSKANPLGREVYGVTPFTATRPLSSAELIGAKLKMAMLSTLATWALVPIAVAIFFSWSGADSVLIDWARWFRDTVGTPRAIVATLVVLSLLITATWMMLVQGLYVGLTGREWLVKTVGFAGLVFVMLLGPLYEWVSDTADAQRWLWDAWTIFPVTLAVFKIIAAIWIARRLLRSNLISDRALVYGAACWTLAVFLLYAVFVWWVDTPMIQRHMLAVFAILAVPLVRIAASPLALAWNRHR